MCKVDGSVLLGEIKSVDCEVDRGPSLGPLDEGIHGFGFFHLFTDLTKFW